MARRVFRGLAGALHHDFCPWANNYVYWLKRPIGWVALALGMSLLLGIYVSPQAFFASGAIAAVGIIGSLWPWLSTLGIRGELHWERARCEEQDSVETQLTIVNRWPWPVWGLVVEVDDALSNDKDHSRTSISLRRVPALSKSCFRWDVRPVSRGVYPKQIPQLSTAFPFGIWSCRHRLDVVASLVVWPRMTKLTDVPPNSGNQRIGIGGTTERAGNDGDWIGVRSFRPGDTLRHVHWAQTARRDQLVVFEHQSLSKQTVSISFDTMAASRGSMQEADCMVRILASIATHFMRHAWEVRIAMDGPWQTLTPLQKHAWLDGLAAWQPCVASESSAKPATVFSSRKEEGLSIRITTMSASSHAATTSSERSDPKGSWTWYVGEESEWQPSRWDSRSLVVSAVESLDDQIPALFRILCQSSMAEGLKCAS
jgi:hypothetical protein